MKGQDWNLHRKCRPEVVAERTAARRAVIKLTFCPEEGKKKECLPFGNILLLLALMLFKHAKSLYRHPYSIFSPE